MMGCVKKELGRLFCAMIILCCVCLPGVSLAQEAIRIMPMGDSVTTGVYGYGAPTGLYENAISYRYELYNMLNTAGYNFDFVGGRPYGTNFFSDVETASVPGISPYQLASMIRTGWNARDGIQETPGPYFETHLTDIVLLLTGIAGFNDGPPGVVDVLDAIDESSEDVVVVLGLIPGVICCSWPEGWVCPQCEAVKEFNNELELLALERIANGDKIVIVDMENGAALDYHEQPVGDMYNDIHPAQSGYDKMAIVWYDALKDILPERDPFAPRFTTDTTAQTDLDTLCTHYSYAVGNPVPQYAFLDGPEGMTFEPYLYGPAIQMQWTPVIAEPGPQPVTIAASNSEGVTLQSLDIYVTLQSVMEATSEGGVIVVPQGVYYENIDFKGKDLVVVSTDPCNPAVVANTIIIGNGQTPAVTFSGAESAACQLSGFTITGGHAIDSLARGGGICGRGTNATISHCVIEGNQSDFTGGGVDGLSGTISHCNIRNNAASTSGGGIAGSTGEIFNCVISGNTAEGLGGAGVDSASALHACHGDVINCTIVDNTGPGDIALRSCDGSFTNCIIWGNNGDGLGFHTAVMSYCCWPEGNEGTGNIAVDPCFATGPLGDYYLSSSSAGQSYTSPCVDAGSDTAANLELDVLSTSTDGEMDNGTVDMGCHYIAPYLTVDINKDWAVNLKDYALLSRQWLNPPDVPSADIAPSDGDGIVDILDLLELAENWLLKGTLPLPEQDPFAPQFTTNAILQVDVDTAYNYYSYAAGNPDPCYTLLEGPAGMTFAPFYGVARLQWAPGMADLGPHPVTIEAGNSEGTALQSFDLYVTLQSVMDATSEGGVIVVPRGVYHENIDFKGKNLVVVSTDPCDPAVVANTVIVGDGSVPAITFSGTETASCKLSGFTITGGHAVRAAARGGGICGRGTGATISHCVIEENLCDFTGGGVDGLSGTISHCSIRNNNANTSGGAISSSSGAMFNCIISGNIAEGLGGAGVDSASALHAYHGDIINCTITNNIGPGDKTLRGCDGSFTNCIIWGNNGDQFSYHTATMSYCCWPEGNEGTGNIAVDPCFAAGPSGDYYLSQSEAGQNDTSPCVDAGSDTSANLELDALSTRTDDVADTETVDMGCHY